MATTVERVPAHVIMDFFVLPLFQGIVAPFAPPHVALAAARATARNFIVMLHSNWFARAQEFLAVSCWVSKMATDTLGGNYIVTGRAPFGGEAPGSGAIYPVFFDMCVWLFSACVCFLRNCSHWSHLLQQECPGFVF